MRPSFSLVALVLLVAGCESRQVVVTVARQGGADAMTEVVVDASTMPAPKGKSAGIVHEVGPGVDRVIVKGMPARVRVIFEPLVDAPAPAMPAPSRAGPNGATTQPVLPGRRPEP